MKRKLLSTVLAVTMAVSRLTGCGRSGTNEATGTGAATTDAKQQDMKQRRASRGCSATVLSYVYFGEGGTREEASGVSFIKKLY